MHFTIHQPVKTTKQVNRVVSLPADISLAWFLARTKSLASRTLAEVAMQAKIYDTIFLGRRVKISRTREYTPCSPCAPQARNPNRHPSPRLPMYANAPATRTTPHNVKRKGKETSTSRNSKRKTRDCSQSA